MISLVIHWTAMVTSFFLAKARYVSINLPIMDLTVFMAIDKNMRPPLITTVIAILHCIMCLQVSIAALCFHKFAVLMTSLFHHPCCAYSPQHLLVFYSRNELIIIDSSEKCLEPYSGIIECSLGK